ncbi:Yip1 family protein [Tautonia rosea]|uniref:Yip1 family protein n=1 Tax=Tautonia rosea TaxID=2728037 RepID=UPI001474A39A|nr:Yip1 family protein [Tautonia rosea]
MVTDNEYDDLENPYRAPVGRHDQIRTKHEIPGLGPDPNPWKTIWRRPRATIRYLVATDPTRSVMLLAALSGINSSLSRAVERNAGDVLPLIAILGLAVVLGPIGGIIWLYLGSALLRWVSGWFGGRGESEHIRTAMAWSLVPVLTTMVFWIPQLILFREEMFQSEMPRVESDPALLNTMVALGGLEALAILILGIWTFVLFLHGLGEVQGYSAWKALGVTIVAAIMLILILLVVVFGIVLLVGGLVAGFGGMG